MSSLCSNCPNSEEVLFWSVQVKMQTRSTTLHLGESFKFLLIFNNFPSTFFLAIIYWRSQILQISHILNLSDYIFVVFLNIFFYPLCFLQLVVRSRGRLVSGSLLGQCTFYCIPFGGLVSLLLMLKLISGFRCCQPDPSIIKFPINLLSNGVSSYCRSLQVIHYFIRGYNLVTF